MGVAEILIALMVIIYFASMWKIFEKAGRKDKWEAFVPVYNIIIWLKIIGKPWWWIFFFLVPMVRYIILIAMNVETARLFGKYEPKDTILSIICPWYYIPFLAYKDENQLATAPTDWTNTKDREKRTWHDHITLFAMAPIVGHVVLMAFKLIGSKQRPGKGSMEYEWTNAIGFAIVAATIIRSFTFEAFTIPTGSMEKTMRIGDYLFVNKLKYGPRLPMTPWSVPFVHNRIPGTFIKSYVTWKTSDYSRLPGYGSYTRGDIMVFNWPVGDSVLLHNDIVAHDYYSFVRDQALYKYLQKKGVPCDSSSLVSFNKNADQHIDFTRKHLLEGGGLIKPETELYYDEYISKTGGIQTLTLDKKENYVKRCVAVGGDKLEVINGFVHINGKKEEIPVESQFKYTVFFKPGHKAFSAEYADLNFGTYIGTTGPTQQNYTLHPNASISKDSSIVMIDIVEMTATQKTVEAIKSLSSVDSIVPQFEVKTPYYNLKYQYCPIYPNHPDFDWTRDNFGPLVIPAEGMKIELTPENWILYKRTIEVYENNEVAEKADGIYINGTKATDYTFKQNYYWMMGDNRHGSVDSRYWGFVGEDHVVGTASFVWMSKHPEKGWFSGGLRWDRVFSFVE
jgi:signal peptidase I